VSASLTLRTPRTLLRPWRDADRAPFAALNVDPRVVEFLPGPLTREASDALVDRFRAHFERHGFGPWVLEIPGRIETAGFVGLLETSFQAHFTPCVEIGWRLAPAAWGHGYATEAASAVIEHGLETLGLPEIVSFTVPANTRSRRVMERLGMTRSPDDDFEHPNLTPGHPLRAHVLYRRRAPRHAPRGP